MKIYLLGLLLVALNVIVAAPSDKDKNDDMENETSKVQQDMILAQLKELHQQLKEQQRRDEEQQFQLREQQHEMRQQQYKMEEQQRRDEEQQYKMEEQQRRVEEVAKIQRARRSSNETVQHLKELVLADIMPMIHVELSACAVGKFDLGAQVGTYLHDRTFNIPFKQNFTRMPEVIASLSGFNIGKEGDGNAQKYMEAMVQSTTTTKFDLIIKANSNMYLQWVAITWIACA